MSNQSLEMLVQKMEDQMKAVNQTVFELKQEVNRLTLENNRLRMQQYDAVEQMTLSQVLTGEDTYEAQDQIQESDPLSPSRAPSGRQRLQTFYDEGVHICHHYFGKKRDLREECIFCQDILDSLGDQQNDK